MPKISVIIPVYNSHQFLQRCIDSVLSNTFTDFELLLINDGSTDNSLNICKKAASKDTRVKVIDKENEGVAITRNKGIKFATAKYIMFIDNDDIVEKDYLQNHYDLISKNDAKVAITGFKRSDSNGKVVRKETVRDTYWSRYLFISPWAKIFDRQFLIENKIEFFNYGLGEDVVFNLRLHSLGAKCAFSDYIGYDWFYNNESVSNTKHLGFDKGLDVIVLFKQIIDQCKTDDYMVYFLKRFAVWYMLYAGKSVTPDEFVAKYSEIVNWFKQNNLETKIGALSRKISGEKIQNRLAVLCFSVFYKMHLLKIFAKMYCKPEDSDRNISS